MERDEFGYQEDIREKKKAATGAHKKKRHTGCTLPFETLSYKERKALMNTPVSTFDLSQPMPYKKFKKLSDNQKRTQLEVYGNKYGWSSVKIAQVLGCAQCTANVEIRQVGLAEKFKEEFKRTSKEKKEQQDRALSLILYVPHEEEPEAIQPPQPIEQVLPVEDTQPTEEAKTAPQAEIEASVEQEEQDSDCFEISFKSDNVPGSVIIKRVSGLMTSLDGIGRYSVSLVIKEVK